MENKRNPIKSYNTEAFVPENAAGVANGNPVNPANGNFALNDTASTSGGGFAPTNGTNMDDGNFAPNPALGQENSSQAAPEALQGPSTPSPDAISTLNQKTLESPANGLKTQNGDFGQNSAPLANTPPSASPTSPTNWAQASINSANPNNLTNPTPDSANSNKSVIHKHKKRAKSITIIAILATAVILAIGVAVAWMIIDNGAKQPEPSPNPPSSTTPDTPEGEEAVELDINGSLVQRLYHNFDTVTSPVYNGTGSFYTPEGTLGVEPNKELMTAIATRVISAENSYCDGRYEDEFSGNMIYTNCRQGEEVRRKVKEIFGKDIMFEDGDLAGDVCGTWRYNAENDEFYVPMTGCGGTCLPVQKRTLDKAEQTGGQIYLYETVYTVTCNGIYRTNGDVIVENQYDDQGMLIGEPVNPEDYKDQFDHFKWIFTKTPEGEYIFEKLEKMEQ